MNKNFDNFCKGEPYDFCLRATIYKKGAVPKIDYFKLIKISRDNLHILFPKWTQKTTSY